MPRKKTFQALRESRKLGPYDDMPMLPDDIQIQVHLSRNDRPQPFHLICEKDTMLLALSGAGTVEFKGVSIDSFTVKAGDCIYIPAGAPHRIVPTEENVMLRYKPQPAGLEGMAWFCGGCGAELHRAVWDSAKAIAQEMYHAEGQRFATDAALRTCGGCGTVHPAPDIAAFRWLAAAREVGG